MMVRVLIIYHTGEAGTRLLAGRIQQRLEDLGAQVTSNQDKDLKDFEAVHDYDIIALGAPCLNCKKCHIPEECRAAKHLGKRIKKLSKMNLRDKKLITFADSPYKEKNKWIRERIETMMVPTKISPIVSVGYISKTPDSLDEIIRTSITEQVIK
jgi:flavodoxin